MVAGATRWPKLKTMKIILLILFPCVLTSCTFVRGTGTNYTLAAVGADLTKVRITATEFQADSVNNSTAFLEVTKRLKQAFDAYLMYQGLTFLGGKYYDKAGAEISSAETIRLQELSNAKSAADAAEKTKQLEMMLAAPTP